MTGASLLSRELAGIINREFDRDQQRMLADELSKIFHHGHGELTITVVKGHVRFLRPMPSLDLQGEKKSDNVHSEIE